MRSVEFVVFCEECSVCSAVFEVVYEGCFVYGVCEGVLCLWSSLRSAVIFCEE